MTLVQRYWWKVMSLGAVLACRPGQWQRPDAFVAPGLAPEASLARGAEFVWGVQGHPGRQAAYAGSGEGLARQLEYLSLLDARHYRVDLYPDAAGNVDPAFDGILEAAEARGISILPLLVARPDANGSAPANYERGHAMGFNFASRHRGRFSRIEAGNELDIPAIRSIIDSSASPPRVNHFEGSSLDHYVDTVLTKTTAFLRGMTDGIHEGSPGTRVIIDAGWRHYGFFEALERDGVAFDVYGYHWYSEMGDFAAEVLPHLPDRRKPIWITEANRRNTVQSYDDPAAQAEWIAEFARRLAATPRVEAVFIYELYDQSAFGSTEPESYYGMVGCTDDGCSGPRRLKPAFHAYRAAIQSARLARAGRANPARSSGSMASYSPTR